MKEKIKEKYNNFKQSKYFYTVIGIFLFLGLTGLVAFAWFVVVPSGNSSAKTTTVTTGNLEITYIDSPQINESNIMPGWNITKTFTVKNTGDVTTKYNIGWANITNTFVNKLDLVNSFTSTNGGANLTDNSVLDTSTNTNIMNGIFIAPNITQTYTMRIKYNNTNANQNDDQGKKISGKLRIQQYNEYMDQCSNLYSDTLEVGGIYTANGTNASGSAINVCRVRSVGYTAVNPSTSYIINANSTNNRTVYAWIYYYTTSKAYISSTSWNIYSQAPYKFTTPSNAGYIRIVFSYYYRSGSSASIPIFNIQTSNISSVRLCANNFGI